MIFMVIERFRSGDPRPVYRRFAESGRLAPDGVHYRGSWVDRSLQRCFQVMEAPSRERLEEWMDAWADLVEFEVVEVLTSDQAARAVAELPERG